MTLQNAGGCFGSQGFQISSAGDAAVPFMADRCNPKRETVLSTE